MANGIANELQAELLRRQTTPAARPKHRRDDKRYSLRSFAEDLDLSHGFLSRVLRGERHMSQDQAHALALKLGLTEEERVRFVDLARFSALKNKRLQKEVLTAHPALKSSTDRDQGPYALLNPEDFSILKRWHYPAILELVRTPPRAHTARSLAKRLALSLVECEVALERLTTNGFLSKTRSGSHDVYSATKGAMATGDLSSAKIRDFHQQMLTKAKESLDRDGPDIRHVTGITFAADAARFEQAKALVQEFRKRMAEVMRTGDEAATNAVYQFSVQLFRLDRVNVDKNG